MVVQERIQVILENIITGQEKIDAMTMGYARMGNQFKNVTRSMVSNAIKQEEKTTSLAKKQQFFSEWSDKLGVNTARVSQIMGNQGLIFNELGEVVDKAGRRITDLNSVMVKGKVETKRFQMQWLSILFFGMAMKRLFSGLVKTSLEWVGITELMSTTLGVVFLPVAEALLNILLPIFDWFMNLPEEVQKVIGWIVIFGLVLGGLLSTVGQFALGIAGIGWLGIQTGLIGMGGAATTASGGISGLLTKLGTLAKFAGVGIAIALMIQDLKEGQVTAAVGMGTLAAGIYTGNPYLIGVGIALKFVGDEEFQINIYKFFWRILDYALWIGEAITKALTGKIEEIDFGKIAFWKSASTALNELSNEGKIASESLNFLAITNSMRDFNEKMEELNEKVRDGSISYGDFAEESRKLLESYPGIISQSESGAFAFNEEAIKVRELTQAYRDLTTVQKLGRIAGALGIGKLEIGGKSILSFQEGGIMPYNGLAYLHAGETITPVGKSENLVLNISYNINVSDKREFEAMLRANTENITREVIRLTS